MLLLALEAVEVVAAVTIARTTYNGCAVCPLDEGVQLVQKAVGGQAETSPAPCPGEELPFAFSHNGSA